MHSYLGCEKENFCLKRGVKRQKLCIKKGSEIKATTVYSMVHWFVKNTKYIPRRRWVKGSLPCFFSSEQQNRELKKIPLLVCYKNICIALVGKMIQSPHRSQATCHLHDATEQETALSTLFFFIPPRPPFHSLDTPIKVSNKLSRERPRPKYLLPIISSHGNTCVQYTRTARKCIICAPCRGTYSLLFRDSHRKMWLFFRKVNKREKSVSKTMMWRLLLLLIFLFSFAALLPGVTQEIRVACESEFVF